MVAIKGKDGGNTNVGRPRDFCGDRDYRDVWIKCYHGLPKARLFIKNKPPEGVLEIVRVYDIPSGLSFLVARCYSLFTPSGLMGRGNLNFVPPHASLIPTMPLREFVQW